MARSVLLTGATGFVGRRLYPALVRAGFDVSCATRDLARWRTQKPDRRWVGLDMQDPPSIERALAGQDAVLYLVHAMGQAGDFEQKERLAAEALRDAAARAQ